MCQFFGKSKTRRKTTTKKTDICLGPANSWNTPSTPSRGTKPPGAARHSARGQQVQAGGRPTQAQRLGRAARRRTFWVGLRWAELFGDESGFEAEGLAGNHRKICFSGGCLPFLIPGLSNQQVFSVRLTMDGFHCFESGGGGVLVIWGYGCSFPVPFANHGIQKEMWRQNKALSKNMFFLWGGESVDQGAWEC